MIAWRGSTRYCEPRSGRTRLESCFGSQFTDMGIAWHEAGDLESLDTDEKVAILNERYDELVSRPINLDQGPVLHVSLIKIAPTQHVLHIALPALCADVTTFHNLLREIGSAYDGGTAADTGWKASCSTATLRLGNKNYWLRQTRHREDNTGSVSE